MNALSLLSRARAELGAKPTPAAIVAWSSRESAAWRTRLQAAGYAHGSSTLARCSACNGRGYTDTDDGAGRWCDAPGCRMGYVRTADVASGGCAVCLGDEVMAEVDARGHRTGLSVPCVCVGVDSIIARRLQSVGVPVKYRGLTLDSWARMRRDESGLLADARAAVQRTLALMSAARCARISYLRQHEARNVHDEVKRAGELVRLRHWSPTEHQAQALSTYVTGGRSGNLGPGWLQHRHIIGDGYADLVTSTYGKVNEVYRAACLAGDDNSDDNQKAGGAA